MTLILLTVLLAWPMRLCDMSLHLLSRDASFHIGIQPSGLVPDLDADPAVVDAHRQSSIAADVSSDLYMAPPWGIFSDIDRRASNSSLPIGFYRDQTSFYTDMYAVSRGYCAYFDHDKGAFVQMELAFDPKNPMRKIRKIIAYAGPDGVADHPGPAIGRFRQSCLGRFGFPLATGQILVYDGALHRFYRIDFLNKQVASSRDFSQEPMHEPVQITDLAKFREGISRDFHPPTKESQTKPGSANLGLQHPDILPFNAGFVLVLDKAGRIDKFNPVTLEFVGTAGYLPGRPDRVMQPDEFLAYDVQAFVREGHYRGLVAVTASYEGMVLSLAVFDVDGNCKASETVPGRLDQKPFGPALLIAKGLLEAFHPALLNAAAYFVPKDIEAIRAQRALFVLPNSYLGDFRQGTGIDTMIGRFFIGLFIISPSILFGAFLAWRVNRDAVTAGLSRRHRQCWLLGTIAFGLSAYITYRLTRPKIRLVTCANCGNLRRPDMDLCHRCGSPWQVPELVAPLWRVLDAAEEDTPPSPETLPVRTETPVEEDKSI
jgi:hypothetical protein